ncbi:sodium:proton exchanger [Carbonactinospora thermoautotrophica]|uniref:Sodium:proton exchanger n=1 Tax=Carbonactinospora thermoautotrophica TaxID=1469144 RepID=A0A132MRS8_9ACTN|nr:Na+/H+ antiporter [Carbonactinospora thermoautotrophica]KWX00504.1 sodium:proton exchanger [Carbonactinospora thermoautotrophica]KWX09592.1 sodium:proton exchanger [Carbonactinospora thermoautotrophica]
MDAVHLFLLVLAASVVAGAARRLGLPPAIVLVVAGVVASFVPGVPSFALEPEVVLLLFLPPLLYAAALDSSYVGFRSNLRPIGLLSIGLVLFTTLVVGWVAYALIPGLPLAAAFTLGAIVAPPDAVAATAIARRVGLPRRIVTILGGESLVNDATALTAYRVAVVAAVSGSFSLLEGVGEFLFAALGGLAIGLVVAPVLHRLRVRLRDPLLENTLELLTPFAVYFAAERIHASGVLSVVVVGLYLGHRAPEGTYATRLLAHSIWKIVSFLLESVVFALIGLQLRAILGALSYSLGEAAWYALVILATVIVARFVWVFPATYLPRWLFRRIRERDPYPPWQYPVVVSWAGMRGVVSLAAAFAIPLHTSSGQPFPGRELILFLTFSVIFGTLVLQGLTLPVVIRWLDLRTQESYTDNLAEAAAQRKAVQAALERLESLTREVAPPDGVVDSLRQLAERRELGAWERLGSGPGPGSNETPAAAFRRLRREMLAAEREVFVRLRDERQIDDEVLRRVLRELDLEEAMIARD